MVTENFSKDARTFQRIIIGHSNELKFSESSTLCAEFELKSDWTVENVLSSADH